MSPDWVCGKGTGGRGFASWERRGPPRPLCSAMPGKLDPLPATSLRLPRSTPCHGEYLRGSPSWRKPLTETRRRRENFTTGTPTSSSASATHSDDFGSFLAILVKRSKAVSSSSAISVAMMSGAGSESVSVRLLSLIQKRSRLSLSRLRSSSLS